MDTTVLSSPSKSESRSIRLSPDRGRHTNRTFAQKIVFRAVVPSHFCLEPKYPGAHQGIALLHLPPAGLGPLLGRVPPLHGELGAQLGDGGVVGSVLSNKMLERLQSFLFCGKVCSVKDLETVDKC